MPGNRNSGGARAKTVAQVQAAGTYREDRHGGFKNMRHVAGRPDMPKDLTGDAMVEWEKMVSRMEQAGSLSKIDDASIYQYAKLFAETREAEVHITKLHKVADKLIAASNKLEGAELVESMRHIAAIEKVLKDYTGTVRMGRMAIRQYLVEFGMTSSARGRIKMPNDAERTGGKLMAFRGGKE